jgi:hypothetical protein
LWKLHRLSNVDKPSSATHYTLGDQRCRPFPRCSLAARDTQFEPRHYGRWSRGRLL